VKKVKVRLRPLVSKLNLPAVIKTAILPGDTVERLFIATQVGEIFYIGDGEMRVFLDIRSSVIELGTSNGGYDERGLLGLAFHPKFYNNGLFYLHYSAAGTQGPGAPQASFEPDPCDPATLHLKWVNRETEYDHIDTVEEWVLQANGQPKKHRTLLNLRRPFANHNGVNSLNFSPETGKLIFTNGDGGSGYDPFNLSQDDMEIAGKIIEIDVSKNRHIKHSPVVTRFNELPPGIQEMLTAVAKGVRNMPGITFQWFHDRYVKYVGNVGQEVEEPIYSFEKYKPIPVTRLVQAASTQSKPDEEGFINFGWRAWEGSFPTPVLRECTNDESLLKKTIAYYDEAAALSAIRLRPLTSYFHYDAREDKFSGNALTGVKAYMGDDIPGLTGAVVFTDFFKTGSQPQDKGALAYTFRRADGSQNDFSEIQVDYDFGSQAAYYVSLGTNLSQTKLYLGVHGSMNVTDFYQGSVFEIIP
jgi:hypothetical protein